VKVLALNTEDLRDWRRETQQQQSIGTSISEIGAGRQQQRHILFCTYNFENDTNGF
jgi:hypothetical protein